MSTRDSATVHESKQIRTFGFETGCDKGAALVWTDLGMLPMEYCGRQNRSPERAGVSSETAAAVCGGGPEVDPTSPAVQALSFLPSHPDAVARTPAV